MKALLAPLALGILLVEGCAQPKPPPDPASVRTPIPAAELRRLLPGHFLDERPYPCDAGPLALQRDGQFVSFSGWGNSFGAYTITDGVVAFDGSNGTSPLRFRITFAKDGNGMIHYTADGGGERDLKLAPIDGNTSTISCGYPNGQPPPP